MTILPRPNPLTDELSDEAKQRLADQFAALRRELEEHEAWLAGKLPRQRRSLW